jgi:hypothetical protein
MLYPKLVNNLTCGDIPTLLNNINCRLTIMGYALYNNTIYMMNKEVASGDMLILLNYKRILTIKYFDPKYCELFTIPMIASRVKKLTLNCKSTCTYDKNTVHTI